FHHGSPFHDMLSFSVRMDASLQYGCVQTKVGKDSSTQIAMTTLHDCLSTFHRVLTALGMR
ncbi:hypothetical protein, partial [Vibrio alfacsensis]|uniref:hypothetical protein n=1 Tax=Vibrio alfacsensis TaxID=1074311 RepID=UPI004068546E